MRHKRRSQPMPKGNTRIYVIFKKSDPSEYLVQGTFKSLQDELVALRKMTPHWEKIVAKHPALFASLGDIDIVLLEMAGYSSVDQRHALIDKWCNRPFDV